MFAQSLSIRDNATQIALDEEQYGYIPQEAVAITFLVLYGISTIAHIFQAIWFRTWWLFPTAVLCGIGELIGWSGRLWSSFSPIAYTPFLIQLSGTALAPTPLLAANFIILSRIIDQLGPCYSRLTPKRYTMVFLPSDVIALTVQAVGGGIASSGGEDDLTTANRGAHIILGGIGFQYVVILIFGTLGVDFVQRYLRDRPVRHGAGKRGILTWRLKIMLGALALSTLTLYIRSIYRIIELASGWESIILRTEVYFDVLDSAMVVLAITTINFAHPGLLLRPERRSETIEPKSREGSHNGLENA
ncbi:RTA1 like protein-domain-containing protein [Mycena galericulata]|nr:RTA1 like protein-domain-containing protein [Mycena galericulata]